MTDTSFSCTTNVLQNCLCVCMVVLFLALSFICLSVGCNVSFVCHSHHGHVSTISSTDQQCAAFFTKSHNPCPLSTHMARGKCTYPLRVFTIHPATLCLLVSTYSWLFVICWYLMLSPPSPPTLSDYWKQSKINGLCPPALHSQLHDHMSTTGTMLCVQGDLVVVYLGLHNQFQSLYLTKHAKETEKKKHGRPKHCRLGVYYHCTHRYAQQRYIAQKVNDKRSLLCRFVLFL